MKLRQSLRRGTDDLHQELDALLGRFDLGRAEDYRDFLIIHARVLPPIEAALEAGGIAEFVPDWPSHRRAALLQRDLAALGAALPEAMRISPTRGKPELLGTAYVIEGSRLGSRFLVKRVGDAMPTEYLTAAGQQKAWPALLHALDNADLQPAGADRALQAARNCFGVFLQAARKAPDHG